MHFFLTLTTLLISSPLVALLVSAAGGPDDRSVLLHPNGNTKKCLNVRGGGLVPGANVDIHDCDAVDHDGLNPQRWNLFAVKDQIPSQGRVKVHGTVLCLDAGRNPKSGTPLTIQTCKDGSTSQSWVWTVGQGDQLILSGTGLCVDLTNGVETNGNKVQVWKCANSNDNYGSRSQRWIMGGF